MGVGKGKEKCPFMNKEAGKYFECEGGKKKEGKGEEKCVN